MGDRSLADWLGEADADHTRDEDQAAAGGGSGDDDVRWDEPPPRRTGRLWLLAVVPWLAVAVGLVALRTGGTPEPVQHEPTPATAPASDIAEPPAIQEGETAREAGEADPAARATAAAASPAVDGLAVAAVHLAVTGGDGDGERYVELAAVEQRTRLDGDTVVVTVLAVVLDGSGGAWTGRRTARFAIPVRLGGAEPSLLGDPWPLPAGDLETRAPEGQAVDDPQVHDAVLEALRAAGYDRAEIEQLERLDLGVLRVVASAVPPGEAASRRVEAWMTAEPEPQLLGHAPGSATPELEEQP